MDTTRPGIIKSDLEFLFHVRGVPAPQGSKNYLGRGGGKGIMVEGNKRTKPWRADVRSAVEEAMDGRDLSFMFDAPLAVYLDFYFPRPKSHYGTGRNALRVKDSAPRYMTNKPDIDKLSRAVLDAITGVLIKEDKSVVHLVATKVYTETTPGLDATIRVLL